MVSRLRRVSGGVRIVENHTRIARAGHAEKVVHQGTFVRAAVSQNTLAKRVAGVNPCASRFGFAHCFAMGNTRRISRIVEPSRRAHSTPQDGYGKVRLVRSLGTQLL
jgi:hypothetical protein